MRTETRTREEKYNVYVANDGKEFESPLACQVYEKYEYKRAYENLPCVTFCLYDIYEEGRDDMYYKIFPIRDKKDMDIINNYLFEENGGSNWAGDFLTEKYIGKSAFICESDSTVYLADEYTIEKMKEQIVSNLDKFINKVKAMEEEYLN